jgi:GDSL-like Lipase/Acylhydrolase family
MNSPLPSTFAALVIGLLFSPLLLAQETKATPAPKKPDPSLHPVEDVAGLPRVLLIGDSISMGYTIPVQKLLEGKANVHRIPTNGGPTINGTAHIKEWLGDGKWDVIHFNWGLHDIRYMPDGTRQVSPEDYEKNLRSLVATLKATGAKLIWCSTTPVVEGTANPVRKNEDVLTYNAIAKKVMDENGIQIDDLYTFALPQLSTIQLPKNVHYNAPGYETLAKQVVATITPDLPAK